MPSVKEEEGALTCKWNEATEEESNECLFSGFVVYFIATKQHHSCVSLLTSVDQKQLLVGECLDQLFGGKIHENILYFLVNF